MVFYRFSILILTISTLFFPSPTSEEFPELKLWYFWAEGCSRCESAAIWLDELGDKYPELTIHEREVSRNWEAREQFLAMLNERDMSASVIPTFIIGDKVWEGFSSTIAYNIQLEIEWLVDFLSEDDHSFGAKRNGAHYFNVGPLSLDMGQLGLLGATLLISLIDGFNPCSLWVLTVLLSIVLRTQSRAKIAAISGTFLLITAIVYGAFIIGLFSAIMVVTHLGWIRWLVALLALIFAAVSIKDWLLAGKGWSFSIPDRFKPSIFRGGREVGKERPLLLTLFATAIFAAGVAIIELPCTAGVAIIELPCTAGFPMIWAGVIAEAGVTTTAFAALLSIYLLVYLLIEIIIIIVALFCLRASRLQETQGQSLKLIGGMVMAAIAIAMLIDPNIMAHFNGSLWVIGGALLLSAFAIGIRYLIRTRNSH